MDNRDVGVEPLLITAGGKTVRPNGGSGLAGVLVLIKGAFAIDLEPYSDLHSSNLHPFAYSFMQSVSSCRTLGALLCAKPCGTLHSTLWHNFLGGEFGLFPW